MTPPLSSRTKKKKKEKCAFIRQFRNGDGGGEQIERQN